MSVSAVPLCIGSHIAATSRRPRARATASKTPNVVVNPAESRSALGGSPQAIRSPQPIPFPGSPGAKPLNPSIPRAAIFHRETPPFSTGLNTHRHNTRHCHPGFKRPASLKHFGTLVSLSGTQWSSGLKTTGPLRRLPDASRLGTINIDLGGK